MKSAPCCYSETEVGPPGPGPFTAVSLLVEAYLEVEEGRYHTAVAEVIKPQATETEKARQWKRKARMAE